MSHPLNQKGKYQEEIALGTTQILNVMFISKNNKRKIKMSM